MYVSISERIEAPYGVLIRISAVVSGANTLKKNALFERDIVGRGITVSGVTATHRIFQPKTASKWRINADAG